MTKFIREPECKSITGLSRVTRWRLEQFDQFPKRYQLSQNTVGWREDEIEEWMQGREKVKDSISSKKKGFAHGKV